MTTTKSEQTTPAELLESFKGRSLKSIVIFTVAVHLVLLVVTGGSYFFKSGEDTSKLSEEERMKLAVGEATSSLREIAEKHGLKPQDLSSSFSEGKPKAEKSAPEPADTPEDTQPADPGAEKSEIEKEIEKVAPGPALPAVEDEDLFK